MEAPVLGERQLQRLPRSRSTSHMLVATNESINASGDDLRDNALEREASVDGLRELAEFLRTTGPRTSAESRIGVNVPNNAKRWSIKSLKRDWGFRSHAQSISHLPQNTVPGKTTDGHNYVAISIPNQYDHLSRTRSHSSPVARLEPVASHQEWPERTSSRRGHLLPIRIPSGTFSQIIRSDSSRPRRGSSAGPTSSPSRDIPSCELTAQDEQFTTGHSSIDRNGTTIQTQVISKGKSKEKSKSSPAERPTQSDSSPLKRTATSHRGLSLNPDATTQSTLSAPLDTLPPESPGFPKMLAAMTFPSPPTSSRPSSPDRSMTSFPPPLTIRPRTSSKRASTSNSVATPTASLNQLLMNSRPSDGVAITDVVIPSAIVETQACPEIERLETPSSPIGDRCGSAISMTSHNPNSTRRSLQSTTTTANSPLTPPTTNESYNFLLRSPPIGMQPCYPTTNDVLSDPKVTRHDHFRHPPSNSSLTLAQAPHTESLVSVDSTFRGCRSNSGHGSTRDRLSIISTSNDIDSRKSIVERRIARKTKVQAYKRRDLDVAGLCVNTASLYSTNLEMKDSPILGWFTREHGTPPNNLTPTSRSGLTAHGGTAMLQSPSTPPPTATVKPGLTIQFQNNDFVLSRIMNTEISPSWCNSLAADPQVAVNKIDISPIMVVSDLRPQDEPSTLHQTTADPPAIRQPPRPSIKQKLKITSQPRQKPIPIMIHRNPATGGIERTTYVINKSNRHSLSSMPLSDSIMSLRRRSHPVGNTRNDSPIPPASFENVASEMVEAVRLDTDLDEHSNRLRIGSRRERIQKAKLSRNQELSRLVAETLSAPRRQDKTRQSQEDRAAQEIEIRLQRLEENGDAWLQVVKSLLNNMSKTLAELRENDHNEGLIKREFTGRANSFAMGFEGDNN